MPRRCITSSMKVCIFLFLGILNSMWYGSNIIHFHLHFLIQWNWFPFDYLLGGDCNFQALLLPLSQFHTPLLGSYGKKVTTRDLMVNASWLIQCRTQQEWDQLHRFKILDNNHLCYHVFPLFDGPEADLNSHRHIEILIIF